MACAHRNPHDALWLVHPGVAVQNFVFLGADGARGRESESSAIAAGGRVWSALRYVATLAVFAATGRYFNSPNSSATETTHDDDQTDGELADRPDVDIGGLVAGCGEFGECLVSSMFQYLLQVRGVLRHQRALLQLGQEVRQPEADQADGNA